MSRVCQITGKGTVIGRQYSRRGLAKRKGGIGKKTTGISPRTFKVNLQRKRIWVPELNRTVRVRLSTRALKTISRNGAFRTLLDAGLVRPPKPKK
ncbi:MAG: 50S ribosomal protein L28 [Planctomycetes bacterium]|nr:50S ribosomal protein L28 [Planctomycetota bacterium]